MSIETFDQAFVKDFSSAVNHLTQQTTSFFKPYVRERMVQGESFDYNNLGAVKAQKKTSYNEDVKVTNAYHERRGATLDTTYVALHIDGDVKKQMLLDLNSGYTQAVAAAMMRDYDITVAKAALGAVKTGKDLTTTTAFAGTTVDATSGLTYAKVLDIKEKFNAKGVGLFDDDKITVAISEKEMTNLLSDATFKSKDFSHMFDYNTRRAGIESSLGMKFIVLPSSPDNDTGILQLSGGNRLCFAFSQKALQVGIRHNLTLKVDELPNKVNTTQIKAYYGIGALRTEDAHVIQINTTA